MSGEAPGHYVGNDSMVNLSRPPISCAIFTTRPLPASVWDEVGLLAKAVDRAARHVNAALHANPPTRTPEADKAAT